MVQTRQRRVCSFIYNGKKIGFFELGVDFWIFPIYNVNRKRQDLKRLCQKKTFYKEVTLTFVKGGRYFFMAMINTVNVIMYIIMYTYSISYHLP